MPPDLALWLTLIGSNYPCLELIFKVPKVFEPLKFFCPPSYLELWLPVSINIKDKDWAFYIWGFCNLVSQHVPIFQGMARDVVTADSVVFYNSILEYWGISNPCQAACKLEWCRDRKRIEGSPFYFSKFNFVRLDSDKHNLLNVNKVSFFHAHISTCLNGSKNMTLGVHSFQIKWQSITLQKFTSKPWNWIFVYCNIRF